MLTKVEVRTDQGALLTLSMQDVSNGYIIEEIEGLDPVKATLVSSSFAQMDGSQYQAARRENRDIRLRLGLEPDFVTTTVWGLRRRLYEFFMPKSRVNLRFFLSSGLTVDISGRVESFDTPLFTKEPAVDITLVCFDPDFYDPTVATVSGNTTAGTTETLINYEGSVDTGLLFTLNVNRDLSAFSFYHRPPDGSLRQLDFAASLVNADVLTINTVPGAKEVSRVRSGTKTSSLYAVSAYSNWITLAPGANYIRLYAEGAAVPFTIDYTNKYGGL